MAEDMYQTETERFFEHFDEWASFYCGVNKAFQDGGEDSASRFVKEWKNKNQI